LQDFQNKEVNPVYRAKLKDKDGIFYVLMGLLPDDYYIEGET